MDSPENAELIQEIRLKFPLLDLEEAIWLCLQNADPSTCQECSALIKFKSLRTGYGGRYCSISCSSKNTSAQARVTKLKNGTDGSFGSVKFKQSMVDKYGVSNSGQSAEIKTKIKETMLERHGVSSGLQLVQDRSAAQSSAAKIKRAVTNLEKYGTAHAISAVVTREKSGATLLKNYGATNPMHSVQIVAKMSGVKLEKYRVARVAALSSTVELISPVGDLKSKNSMLSWRCVQCSNELQSNLDDGKTPRCIMCYPHQKTGSALESKFLDLISSDLGPVRVNDRTQLSPLELDFYWPEKNMAVEISGLYWHSENVGGRGNKELSKLEQCTQKNIRLLTFYEDEVLGKAAIVRSIVLAAAGVFKRKIAARKTTVRELTAQECREFIDLNHIQGYSGGFLKLGLEHQGELVAALVIGKSRFKSKSQYELIRFCQSLETQIVGGFAKLLAAAKRQVSGTCVSYADRRLFTGAAYLRHGFGLDYYTSPGFYWTDYRVRINRQRFQRHKLPANEKTAAQIVFERGYDRIWDCGQAVFTGNL